MRVMEKVEYIMMRFPITDLLDGQECYNFLLQVLRPDGLKCPEGHVLGLNQAPHRRSSSTIDVAFAVVYTTCSQTQFGLEPTTIV